MYHIIHMGPDNKPVVCSTEVPPAGGKPGWKPTQYATLDDVARAAASYDDGPLDYLCARDGVPWLNGAAEQGSFLGTLRSMNDAEEATYERLLDTYLRKE